MDSLFPEPLTHGLCGGSLRQRLLRTLREIPQLASRRNVILSTDCGAAYDDQAALAYLALTPAVNLVGIVSSFTPNVAWPYAETTAANTRSVLKALPLKRQPPVVAGSNRPLEEMESADYAAAEYIIRESQAYDGNNRLTIVVIGPATDVAAALMRDPTLEDRIEVVAMAFKSWPSGKDGYNAKNDVWSWQVLMESATPVIIGCDDVCKRHLMVTRNEAPQLLPGKVGAQLCLWFLDWTGANANLVESMTGRKDAAPMWDLVTVAYLAGHTRSVVYPRPILQDDASFTHHSPRPVPLPESTDQPNVRWITSLDTQGFWKDFAALLADADRA